METTHCSFVLICAIHYSRVWSWRWRWWWSEWSFLWSCLQKVFKLIWFLCVNKLFSVSARLQPQNWVCVTSQKHPARFLSTKILLKVISSSINQQTELLQNTPTGQTDETWQNIITNTVQHNAFFNRTDSMKQPQTAVLRYILYI